MNLSIVPYNSSFGPSIMKVENEEEEDKLPNSYLDLLNEEPTVEKPCLDYVVEKVVLPSPCNVVTKVKPSIRVQSRTNEAYGSGSKVKVAVGKRSPRGKSSQQRPEKLRSWNEVSYINKNCDFYSELYGNGKGSKGVRAKKCSDSRKKSTVTENKRKKKIERNIRALGELLPHETADASESIMDDVIAHVKLLQLQMKELSRSRLGGEPVSHPMISIEGFGHYIQHEKMKTKPLEEVIGDMLANDFDAAARFFESKGLYLMPLSSAQGFP